MKFQKENLENAISQVSMVVKNNSTIPALDYIKVYWKENHAYFAATDLQITMVAKFPYEDQFEDFLLDTAKIISIVKLLKYDVDIEVITIEGHVTIKQEKSKYNLSSPSAKDYPDIVHNDDFVPIGTFNKSVTKALIGANKFTGNDELRPAMNGVFVTTNASQGQLVLVATDAHKLVEYSLGFKLENKFEDFIIPSKALNIATKIYKDEYKVIVSEKKIMFTDNAVTMIITKIDAKYPGYKAVIPKDNTNTFEVDSNEFKTILKQVSVVKTATSTVKVHLEGALIVLDAEDLDIGDSAHAEMMGEVLMTEDKIDIGYNMLFVDLIIKELSQEKIKFEFSTPNRATIIHDECDDYSLLALIMPVMLNV